MTDRLSFEDAIVNAIAGQFFESKPSYTDPNGSMSWAPAPAMNVANALYERNKEAILEACAAALDIDALAEKMAAKVMADLTERPSSYGTWHNSAAKAIQDAVRAAVVEKLATAAAEQVRASMENADA